ncbi:MAG: hypothetical protein KDD60_12660, partial [Bdellovibrionales bacterium]|nr:hypothetical protein [Bdellovibrionales bacterium]
MPSLVRQLGLAIRPRLSYSRANFLVHAGIAEAHAEIQRIIDGNFYPVVSVVGERRSGKTHFAVHLTETLSEVHDSVYLFDGEQFRNVLLESSGWNRSNGKRYFIVDDADRYLASLDDGESGALVRLIEELRVQGGYLVFFRGVPLESYGFDDHLRSRFRSGMEWVIGDPDRSEVLPLLNLLCRQRGIRFPEKKLQYLSRRLGNSL